MNFGWVALAVVADAVLAPDLRIFGARLELSAACLCFLRVPDRIVGAWILGMWRDCLSIGPLGVYAIPFLGLAVFLETMKSRWFVDNLPTRAAQVFVSVAAVSIASAVLGRIAGSGAGVFTMAWTSVASAIYTTLVVSIASEVWRVGRAWGKFASRLSRA